MDVHKNIYSGSVRAAEAEICGGLIRRERFSVISQKNMFLLGAN